MNLWMFLLSGLVGAAIGYITNAIAIKMLFRPYKAHYIGRFKLPFTPGIIPRQRDRLAVSLGKMVSQQLFEKEGLLAHLGDPGVQDVLYKAISGLTSSIFGSTQTDDGAKADKLSLDTKTLSVDFLKTFLGSPRFEQGLKKILSGLFDLLLALSPQGLGVSAKSIGRLQSFLSKFLSNKHSKQASQRLMALMAMTLGKRPRLLSPSLVSEIVGLAKNLASRSYPFLTKALIDALSTTEIKTDLVSRAKRLLSKAIEELNPLQRGLMRLGNYEASLHKILPGFVDQTLLELESFLASQQTIALWPKIVADFLDHIGTLPLADLEERYGFSFKDLAFKAYQAVGQFLQEGGLVRLFVASKPVQGGGEAQSFAQLFGIDQKRKQVLARQVSAFLILQARKPALAEKLVTLVVGIVVGKVHLQPGLAAALRPQFMSQKESFDRLLLESVSSVLAQVLPKVVNGFNLQKMVEGQVSKLDMAQLEGLIIGLVGREFAWINVFGAILGFGIGTIQVLITYLFAVAK